MGRAEGEELCVASREAGNAAKRPSQCLSLRAGQRRYTPWLVARSAIPNHLRAVAESQRVWSARPTRGGRRRPCRSESLDLPGQSKCQALGSSRSRRGKPGAARVTCLARLKFLDAFPYESFKTAVWDDGLARGKPASPNAGDTPPPCQDEDSTRATNPVAMTERERIPFCLQLDAQTVASSRRGPEIVALASPHPPTPLEAYRSQIVSAGKVASLPWLVVLLIGLSVSILLGLLATGHLINLWRLGTVLGLTG